MSGVLDSLGLGKKKRGKRKGKRTQTKAVNELLVSLRTALEEKKVEDALKQLIKLEKLFKG